MLTLCANACLVCQMYYHFLTKLKITHTYQKSVMYAITIMMWFHGLYTWQWAPYYHSIPLKVTFVSDTIYELPLGDLKLSSQARPHLIKTWNQLLDPVGLSDSFTLNCSASLNVQLCSNQYQEPFTPMHLSLCLWYGCVVSSII